MEIKKQLSKIYYGWPVPLRVALDNIFNPPPYLNSQWGREKIVRDIFGALPLEVAIETGTFRGGSTGFFASTFGIPVYSVELDPTYHAYSKRRLRNFTQIYFSQGDSREFLRRLSNQANLTSKFAFFYLDAHWWDDLPLLEEIQIVRQHWKRFVVLVDDFKVSGDAGYEYDDYGAGKILELECFPELKDMNLDCFFPSLPSAEESGLRRGCVVFSDHETGSKLRGLKSLREHALGS